MPNNDNAFYYGEKNGRWGYHKADEQTRIFVSDCSGLHAALRVTLVPWLRPEIDGGLLKLYEAGHPRSSWDIPLGEGWLNLVYKNAESGVCLSLPLPKEVLR